MSKISLLAYKALLSQSRAYRRLGAEQLTIRLPVNADSVGRHDTWEGSGQHRIAVQRYLGDLAQTAEPAFLTGLASPAGDSRCTISTATLEETIRDRFRSQATAPADQQQELQDKAFKALRLLSEQTHLLECSSESVTEGVQVEMTSGFIGRLRFPPGTSRTPARYVYEFAYRARIQNVGRNRVKLLGRHWRIQDAAGKSIFVPKGSRGVVGCTPILKPGDTFEYHSGTPLETITGQMSGSFQMAVLDDANSCKVTRHFDATINPFRLIGNDSGGDDEWSDDEMEEMQ